jgi:hypothetical protein
MSSLYRSQTIFFFYITTTTTLARKGGQIDVVCVHLRPAAKRVRRTAPKWWMSCVPVVGPETRQPSWANFKQWRPFAVTIRRKLYIERLYIHKLSFTNFNEWKLSNAIYYVAKPNWNISFILFLFIFVNIKNRLWNDIFDVWKCSSDLVIAYLLELRKCPPGSILREVKRKLLRS